MLLKGGDAALSLAVARHHPILEKQSARHNLILGLLDRALKVGAQDLRFWSFGTPGSCALQTGVRNIVLGELATDDEAALAASLIALPFEGIVGPDDTAVRLARCCEHHGIALEGRVEMAIHELSHRPRFPEAPGRARPVRGEDIDAFRTFSAGFLHEIAPHEPAPPEERIAADVQSGRYLFWTVDELPVSMAGKVRETSTVAAIGAVYTAQEHRGRGYAGAVTAALCERLFAEGKRSLCLYTDLANPYSNRCYARIGFEPVCRSVQYLRKQT